MSSAPAPPATTPSSAPPGPRRATWTPRILWANLVAQIGIVVTGGAVRLTGSGLGCSSWPQCEPGQFTPVLHEAASWHPYIEFGNRSLTGVLGLLALATAWAIWSQRSRARSFRLLGLVPLVGVVIQAVVGGMTVLFELHPGLVAGHFLISMLLIAASTALLLRHREGDGPPIPLVGGAVRRLTIALIPLLTIVLALGVLTTGSGPHSGDENVAYRFALDPVGVARVHAASVWLYVAAVVALVVLVRRSGAVTAASPARASAATASPQRIPRRAAVALLGVTLLQGAIGYLQYVTGLPEVLVGAHMLGASLLVVAQVNQALSVRARYRT